MIRDTNTTKGNNIVSMNVNMDAANNRYNKDTSFWSFSSLEHLKISTINEIAVYSAAREINDWNAVPNMKYILISLYPHLENLDKPSGQRC